MGIYHVLAVTVLAVHLAWILWVIFGAFFTQGRPALRWFHIASLVYGILIETLLWPCPLTILEQGFQARAGIEPYKESFLIHYLEKTIYPDVPQTLLTVTATIVCLFNLAIYGRRYRWRTGGIW